LVCGRVRFWCCTSADGKVPGIHHSIHTRGGDYQSSTWHSIIYITLCFTLSVPILLSAIFVRWRLRRKQHSVHAIQFNSVHAIQLGSHTAFSGTQQYTEEFPFAFKDEYDIDASSIQFTQFNSVHALQFSSHTAVSGTQQYIEEFPFAFKDEHDMAQQYIVGVSYVLEDQHDTSSFHSSLYFRDSFYSYISFRLVDAPGFRLRCNHAACYWTQSIFAATVRYMIYFSFNIKAWRRYAMVHFGLCIYAATYGATYSSAKII